MPKDCVPFATAERVLAASSSHLDRDAWAEDRQRGGREGRKFRIWMSPRYNPLPPHAGEALEQEAGAWHSVACLHLASRHTHLRMANHIQDLLNKLNDGYKDLTNLQAEGAVGKFGSYSSAGLHV